MVEAGPHRKLSLATHGTRFPAKLLPALAVRRQYVFDRLDASFASRGLA